MSMENYRVSIYMNDEGRKFLDDFNRIVGCMAKVPDNTKVDDYSSVEISIDREKITRGAGRKAKRCDKKICDVYEYEAKNGKTAAAAYCGLSLRTYDRWKKRLEDQGEWFETNDFFFNLPEKT